MALSGDGMTALIGGYGDQPYRAYSVGAAWVFVRSGTTWTEQGPKLVGTGVDLGYCGSVQGSVALSFDGNTALSGGQCDNNNTGAVWVFTRSGTTWSQQGPKLVVAGSQ